LRRIQALDKEHDPKQIQTAVERAAVKELELSFRPMFGGIMAYVGGRAFASVSNRGLALKLGSEKQDELLAIEGSRRLQYEPAAPVSKTYVLVPDAMLSRPKELRQWLQQSAAFVAAATAKKRKTT